MKKSEKLHEEIRQMKALIARVEQKQEAERTETKARLKTSEEAQKALEEARKEEQSTWNFLHVQYDNLRRLHEDFFEAVDQGE